MVGIGCIDHIKTRTACASPYQLSLAVIIERHHILVEVAKQASIALTRIVNTHHVACAIEISTVDVWHYLVNVFVLIDHINDRILQNIEDADTARCAKMQDLTFCNHRFDGMKVWLDFE